MNKDKKFHWFPFYYQAWMTDMNVQMLSHSEKGLYIDMLCLCFNEDGLPTDHKMLKRLFKCDDDDLQMVVTLFHERDGKLHNKKLDEIKGEQAEVSKQKSAAGKASAEARKAKRLMDSTPVEQPLNPVATEPQQNPTSREEESREEESKENTNTDEGEKPKSKAFTPPTLDEFIAYAQETMPKLNPDWKKDQITRCATNKFETYVADNWCDGFGKKIESWKNKARNSLKHEKPWNYGQAPRQGSLDITGKSLNL